MNLTLKIIGAAFTGAGGYQLWNRYSDHVEGDDSFSLHTNVQHKKHWISGMHEAYLPNSIQSEFIDHHFSQFKHLIPSSQDEVVKQCTIKPPVQIRHLSECPNKDPSRVKTGETVVVGGPPALISTSFENNITYINDGSSKPIAYGSALHLEWDAVSEAPTTSQPIHFMMDQIKRLVHPEFLAKAETTAQFSWKSLDWASWIKNPSHWAIGTRIAIAFQQFTQNGPNREVMEEVAKRTKKNEEVYKTLDSELNQELLLPGNGSIYVARNQSEKKDLLSMEKGLLEEEREFSLLSSEQQMHAFGYLPRGVLFARKVHDRSLSPHFISLLSKRIIQKGGSVIDGRVLAVYTDDPDLGGIVEYRTSDGSKQFISFKKLVMSLGTTGVIGVDNKSFFDIVSARGISAIALAHLPLEASLPPVVVCGGTNHVTKLAGPVLYQGKSLYLVRMTCGACITPLSDSFDYDGIAAVGLKRAVSDVLKGKIEILTVYGCNRQVSQYGQIHWLQVPKTLKSDAGWITPRGTNEDVGCSLPKKPSGIFIQYGAGGGGLTQAPSHE